MAWFGPVSIKIYFENIPFNVKVILISFKLRTVNIVITYVKHTKNKHISDIVRNCRYMIWFDLKVVPLLPLLGVNTLRPRQNGRHFTDDSFGCIFLNENVRIAIKIWLNFFLKGPINNIPALVQIMAWRRTGDKPLSEPMMVSLPTHLCVTRPQWVNISNDIRITVTS